MAEILGVSISGKAVFAVNAVAPLAQLLGVGAGVLFAPVRRIGLLIPGVVLEEDGQDQLEITRHPVERGAPVSDHAFKLPAELVMRCAWGGPMGPAYLRGVYQALLALQAEREPFTVSTGKRVYPNMLMRSLSVSTAGPRDENLLAVTCAFQEVLFAETQETTLAPRESQAQPHNTAAPVAGGSVAALPTNTNIQGRLNGPV